MRREVLPPQYTPFWAAMNGLLCAVLVMFVFTGAAMTFRRLVWSPSSWKNPASKK